MVFDKLTNLDKYISTEQFQKIERFLRILSPDMEEKRYEIDGEAIFARVMSYSTSMPYDCKIEAHEKYIDIQASLEGLEGIDIFDKSSLTVMEDYDGEKDVAFYEETTEPHLSVNNVAGYFTMIFPHEAHRPQISVNRKCDKVKKFVIKIHI